MKRFLSVTVVLVFALACFGTVMAAEKAQTKSPTEPPAVAAPQAVSPERGKKITGTIESLDAAAGTFSVKAKKETVQLKAGEKVKLGNFKVGDKVTVTYTEDTATQIATAQKVAKKKKKGEEPAKK